MVRAGLFDDVDFALHWHPADRNSAAARTTLANRSAKFRFRALSAHAAGAPDRGRSALDGVEAMNFMVNLMREHVPQQTRIHYVITAGGNAPNVVPDYAEVFYYLRHPEAATVQALWQRLEAAARGAAEGTGTEVDWEIIHGNHPVLVNETLHKMMDATLRELGGMSTAPRSRLLPRDLRELRQSEAALGSEAQVQPYSLTLGYGSTDVGDVSMTVPTVGVRIATWVPGTQAHSWQAVAAGGSSIGFRGADLAARALSSAAVRLCTGCGLRAAALAEFASAGAATSSTRHCSAIVRRRSITAGSWAQLAARVVTGCSARPGVRGQRRGATADWRDRTWRERTQGQSPSRRSFAPTAAGGWRQSPRRAAGAPAEIRAGDHDPGADGLPAGLAEERLRRGPGRL
jgi:hypothetical protein